MAEQWRIDPDRISEKPMVFDGALRPGDLPRLRELLATPEGELSFRVAARLDGKRRRIVSCIINGFVFLTCQATLESFRHPLHLEERLVLVDDESRLPPIEEESDAEDHVVADAPLDVRDLVEDAVILALPMVPRKPGFEEAPAKGAEPAAGKDSPFAALAGLKREK